MNPNKGGQNSPFINQTSSVKKRKRPAAGGGGYEDTKSKMSTYRQRYYDNINGTHDGSAIDKNDMTVTTRNSVHHKTATRSRKKGPYWMNSETMVSDNGVQSSKGGAF